MTGLPFVWAFWAGRPEIVSPAAVAALREARDAGVAASDAIAAAYCGPERAALGQAYLRDNIQYDLGARQVQGIRAYYALATRHQLIDAPRQPLFYNE